VSGLFAREMEDTFYYFAVKSSVSTFAKDFGFKIVGRLFGGNQAGVALGRNQSFVDGSEMLADGIIENAKLNLVDAE